jgi:hypothetical protein
MGGTGQGEQGILKVRDFQRECREMNELREFFVVFALFA